MIVSMYFRTVAPELFGSVTAVDATVSCEVSRSPAEEETSVSVLPMGGTDGSEAPEGVVLPEQPNAPKQITGIAKIEKTGKRTFFMVLRKKFWRWENGKTAKRVPRRALPRGMLSSQAFPPTGKRSMCTRLK